MGTFIQPTKCFVQSFTINGQELCKHVHAVQIYETLCKPYITARAVFIDTNNIMNTLKIVGGEPVTVTINSSRGTYSADLHILSVKGNESAQNLRAQSYAIDLIGREYFGDRTNMVQHSFKGITGTNIIQKLHSMFMSGPINIPVPSIGLFGQFNPYVISSVKPFKAINDIRKMLAFAQYQSGATMYYRDANGINLTPMEHLFQAMDSTQTFIQKATWGASLSDLSASENAVISAIASIDENSTGRLGVQDISSRAVAERRVNDMLTHKSVFNIAAKFISDPGPLIGVPGVQLIGNILNSIAGGHGGEHNFYFNDSTKIPNESVRSTDRDKLYQATIKNGPQWMIKVPIQSGLKVTVGKGIYAKLLPPVGDATSPVYAPEQTGGKMLVVDICHEVHNNDKMMAGTTTMRCVKGGFDQ